MKKPGGLLFIFLFLSLGLSAQPADNNYQKYYQTQGETDLFIPLGKTAFADSIVAFNPGDPSAEKRYRNPEQSLGEPEFTRYRSLRPRFVSIGCGGVLTIKFNEIGFTDIEGPDLVFYEVGPEKEPFQVDISIDGRNWLDLGKVEGGRSTVDLSDFLKPNEKKQVYYFIRLTDLKSSCGGPTPGADIDAIGAIGAVIRHELKGKALFETDEFSLNKKAHESLDILLKRLKGIPKKAQIHILGHTDSDGSTAYNMQLGLNRANAVRQYIEEQTTDDYTFSIESYGKSKPVHENTTEEGKQENRRVEIIVFPDKAFYKPSGEKEG